MGEMYNDSMHFPGNYWVPNPNLRPETSGTTEFGLGLRFDNLVLADDNLQFKSQLFRYRRPRLHQSVRGYSVVAKLTHKISPAPKFGAGMHQ
ncbi:ABC-type hemin transport system, periplasmic component [Serratia fonticola]|uniref:ABC-type hemin transport system, periplasmic component n=1 Tax=Serratia fonticola TaxID=47917 RepID=A0A4U9WEZ2_SERFO|nr:ABC-type hemin transport system, periplasmic component [Serratia fonticola]